MFSVKFSQMMGYLTIPYEAIPWVYAEYIEEDQTGVEFVRAQMKIVVIWMCCIAACLFFGIYVKVLSFGIMGETVTYNIRKLLYASILEKHMGWFDDRDHATSVLTTAMAEDTNKINEVGSATLSSVSGACASILVGFIIAFYFNW